MSTETIYSSLYVQSRGALRRDLAVCLRTGRALRRPSRAPGRRKNRIPDMVNVSERASGYTMLLHLPDGYKPEQVRDALAAKVKTLPDSVRHTLTWDQGPEMRDWKAGQRRCRHRHLLL